jgi:hypothetical protein
MNTKETDEADRKSMSVDTFRQQLRKEVATVCSSLGSNFDKEQDRGFAFQYWVADLLLKIEDIDSEVEGGVFKTNDLKIDLSYEDEDGKLLVLGQTKFVSLASNPDISESEVNDFFARHEILKEQSDWVFTHASDDLYDLISDYDSRLKTGWKIAFYFVSTGKASPRLKQLVEGLDKKVKETYENVSFELFDFYGLKELYVRSQAIEATISEFVDIQFAENTTISKQAPHRTLVSVVKGNSLVNLYKKEKDSLFAYNIRSFMGKRVNKDIVETAKLRPSEFYYFNNGVSAICTKIEPKGKNSFRFYNFQVINGAQTIGSLAAVRDLSSECEVLLRITEGASVKTEKGFNADIIKYNNTQNVVKASDFRSNDKIQLWLEDKLQRLRPRGAISAPLRYVRKRSHHRVRAAIAIKFEEFSKIRFAYLWEPTKCIADPRSLWTLKEDGGNYEDAFGIDGELYDFWDDKAFEQTLFAILTYLRIIQKIKELIKKDKADFHFLQRLRFWAVSLARTHTENAKIDLDKLVDSETEFKKWFEGFWKLFIQTAVPAHQNAQNDGITNFALVRNEGRWQQAKRTFSLLQKSDIDVS